MKKRLLLGVMVLLTVLPVLQIVLVKRYDVSPWKLAGWGMYAAPWRNPWARIDVLERGSWSEIDRKRTTPWLSSQLREFSDSRAALGRLCPPDRIADELWVERPEVTEVRITVREAVLDITSGMIVNRETPYRYKRN